MLQTGELSVRRPDALELLSVRDGGHSYEELVAETGRLEAITKRAAEGTMLPADVQTRGRG